MAEDRRIFEYFVVAGLPEKLGAKEEQTPGAVECGYRNTAPQAPITDICVIFPASGEKVPDGFTMIESTPTGYPADLNHGSLRTPSCFLCYRRGYHKPPLVDIGVLQEGKGERVMVDSQILQTTPFGRPANVNNGSQGIYLTYRRASENSPPNLLAVTDICVILANKGESAPHTFCKITKDLNKGMVGSNVFICYKKSQANTNRIAYQPAILDRFPRTDDSENPLPPNVPIFCLPMGAVLECWPVKCQTPAKLFSTFVLTDEKGRKFYGAAVTFFETYDKSLTADQMERLGIASDAQTPSGSVSDNSSTNDPAEQMTFHMNKSICVVSRYPFFVAFKRFLFYLYRMSVTGKYSLPIERYISHLMFEVPFPTPRRPRVLVQLGNETISFDNHDDTPLPLSGAAFIDFLKTVGVDNAMYLLLLALLEHKILIHSLRPWLMTSVAEAICSLIFPFHWQCPYIPQCPLDLAGVLHAPLPFIAGVDSRYFELYEDPPKDVTCVDLDTATISNSETRKNLKLSLLPKKPARILRQTLENLHRKVHQEDWNVTTMRSSTEFMPVDVDLKLQKRRRNLELEIQEAFLRFMAYVLRGYRNFLKPIKAAPKAGSTDTGSLFDIDGFLRSRDSSAREFYKKFSDTQTFIRFVEERSLLSDKNAYLAFFDDCVEKIDPSGDRMPETRLLECESSLNANHTVFIAPPEPFNKQDEKTFAYKGFPSDMHPDNFQMESLVIPEPRKPVGETPARGRRSGSFSATTPAIGRTRQEAMSAQKIAKQEALTPVRWAKCLLSYSYSLWFIHLPAYVKLSSSKTKALRTAFQVLDRMHNAHLPILDEVCYRILMQLCGEYGRPLMTVKVFMIMKQQGLQPNAITYGYYNRAVLEANWPNTDAVNAEKMWTKLRHTIRATALFNRLLKESKKRRTLSQISRDSGAEPNMLSLTSLVSRDSQGMQQKYNPEVASVCTATSTEKPDSESGGNQEKGSPLDPGYQSVATEDSVSTDQNTIDTEGSVAGGSQSLMLSRNQSFVLSQRQLETFDEHQTMHGAMVINRKTILNSICLDSYDSPAGLLMVSDEASCKLHQQKRRESDPSTGDSVIKRPVQTTVSHIEGRRSLQPLLFKADKSATPSPTAETPTRDFTTPTSGSARQSQFVPSSFGDDAHIIEQIDQKPRSGLAPSANVDETETISCEDESVPSESSPTPGSMSHTPTKVPALPITNGDPLSAFVTEEVTTVIQKTPETVREMSPQKAQVAELMDKKPFQGEEFQYKANPETPTSTGAFSSIGRASMRLFSKIGTPKYVSKYVKSQTTDGISTSVNSISEESSKESGSISKPETPCLDGVNLKEDPELHSSPSFSLLVNQAWTKVGDVMQKQQPNIDLVKKGIGSALKNVKGVSGIGSPMRGSLNSLMDDYRDEIDSRNLYGLGGLDSFYRDPAFQLSSGETGSILSYDFTGLRIGDQTSLQATVSTLRYLVEATLCSSTRCSSCTCILYDEEIMAKWTSDESNLNTKCQFCGSQVVPSLTVRIQKYKVEETVSEDSKPLSRVMNSWYWNQGRSPRGSRTDQLKRRDSGYARTGMGASRESLQSLPGTPMAPRTGKAPAEYGSLGRRPRAFSDQGNNGLLPLGVKRELFPDSVKEDASERSESKEPDVAADDNCAAKINGASSNDNFARPTTLGDPAPSYTSKPIIEDFITVPFLSPLVLRKEIENLVVLDEGTLEDCKFVDSNPILFWNLLYMFHRLSVPTHLSNWIVKAPCLQSANDEEETETQVLVRCVYDNSTLHETNQSPLYLRNHIAPTDIGSPLVAALVLEQKASTRSLVAQILDYLTLPNLHKPIQLLINEHRKRIPIQASPSHHLPKHFSIYRDILFLALAYFGREVRLDDFDREYLAAYNKLPPKIAGFLPPSDYPPSLAARCCRRIFIPLDVS